MHYLPPSVALNPDFGERVFTLWVLIPLTRLLVPTEPREHRSVPMKAHVQVLINQRHPFWHPLILLDFFLYPGKLLALIPRTAITHDNKIIGLDPIHGRRITAEKGVIPIAPDPRDLLLSTSALIFLCGCLAQDQK
jgi:hypothetical protein